MRQTWAIFVDAYRELNSKKLFWVVLATSLAVVVALALPKNNSKGIEIFGATADFPLLASTAVSAKGFYSFLFSWIGINLWLAWGATILALISTASIIPDMISSGSIELTLSRPISRLRLFLTKYATGLMFVGLQAAVFAIGAIFVIGIRAGSWEWRPLLAIPLMVAFFSYLFCICVLVGLITRSTLMALLATVVIWLGLWALGTVEGVFLDQKLQRQREVDRIDGQLSQVRSTIAAIDDQLKTLPAPEPAETTPAEPEDTLTTPEEISAKSAPESSAGPPDRRRGRRSMGNLIRSGQAMLDAAKGVADPESLKRNRSNLQRQLDTLEREAPAVRESFESTAKWHRRFFWAMAILPKTGETKALFQRFVVDAQDQEGFLKMINEMANDPGASQAEDEKRKRSLGWVLGTSLGFEIVILGFACWIFCRRDF